MTPIHTPHAVDQFDNSSEDMAKEASALTERRAQLADAPESDFALVLWNGMERSRKFPVASAQDVHDSHAALEKNASTLPDEVVKTARHFIELGAREHLQSSLYPDAISDDVVTNLVYSGDINQMAYAAKREVFTKEASTHFEIKELGTTIWGPTDVERCERTLASPHLNLTHRERYEASRSLLKAASLFGVEVSEPECLRYGRDETPDMNLVLSERATEARAVNAPKAAALYEKLASVASQNAPVDVAEALEAIDRLAGFASLEGERVANTPIGLLFNPAFEEVFPIEQAQEEKGYDFDKVAGFFGDSFADSLRENPSKALQSLSSVERMALDNL